jgi:NhaP-type Na+/H+ or K+/H+ antiporter
MQAFDPRAVVYAVLSLTLIRMVPVFLCVGGLGLRWDTKLFLGWFGPRGLASIVFVVMVSAAKLPGNDLLISTVVWTILLSVAGHGLTANPLAKVYGDRVKARGGST